MSTGAADQPKIGKESDDIISLPGEDVSIGASIENAMNSKAIHLMSEEKNDGLEAFIALSQRTRMSGDLDHAEKLLKGGLKRAEEDMTRAEVAVVRFLDELIAIYEAQGRNNEADRLRKRLDSFRKH